MTNEQPWLAATGGLALALALVGLMLGVLAWRRARHTEARLQETMEAYARRLELLESTAPAADESAAYVITHLDDPDPSEPSAPAVVAERIDGRLFADIVAREAVVKAAAWTHGVRRALAPETRDRIRLRVRQETRQAGRERKAELKQALREFRARERDASARSDPRHDLGEDVA